MPHSLIFFLTMKQLLKNKKIKTNKTQTNKTKKPGQRALNIFLFFISCFSFQKELMANAGRMFWAKVKSLRLIEQLFHLKLCSTYWLESNNFSLFIKIIILWPTIIYLNIIKFEVFKNKFGDEIVLIIFIKLATKSYPFISPQHFMKNLKHSENLIGLSNEHSSPSLRLYH